ncbi:hypothetical protein GCK72_005763 [Caenorhabditis remanei]|uniref:Doublecortin domain-containing protein n=1 Tax=Caenorhabditis remanei TaxID=31234 RepID=A0A6A5HDG9_CAERE|nr:hypothetical protein GCK72_005763 [Caenorhabditis remanei]KAF1765810.1 hypothetical protein GCK72_005763 [Caenorhabditis remanei]
MSKQPKTFRSRSSDHVPVVPTMVSQSNAVGVKRIHVWRNADVFFQGIQVVVNTHRVPSIDVLLDVISSRIGLINGAKKLYTTSGTLIKDINKIKDGENYVASSSHFTPAAYGGQQQQQVIKKKKKRSKTVQGRKTEHIELGEEISIPLNEPVEHEKKKKKKKVVKKKVRDHSPHHLDRAAHHGSDETLAETAEVELPSEIEDSEEEEDERDHHYHRDKTPDHHRRPSTKASVGPSRSTSRRESRRDVHDHNEKKDEDGEKKNKDEKRRKSVSRRKSQSHHHGQQPNWGDLSSFTKNIDSLLRN